AAGVAGSRPGRSRRARSLGHRASAAGGVARCARRGRTARCAAYAGDGAGGRQLSAISSQETKPLLTASWNGFFERLQLENRAFVTEVAGHRYWVAAERVEWFQAMHRVGTGQSPVRAGRSPAATQALNFDDAVLTAVQGWIAHLGPTTASEIGEVLGLPASEIEKALLRMEASGAILRGKFRPADSRPATSASREHETEWCERRLLARIHRLTVATLR